MSVTNHDISDWIKALDVGLPAKEEFWRLGDRTALRHKEGQFYRSNYERGMLLYALIAHYRPRAVIEFGTGRGYGTLCMAWAMADHDIDGKIYTVDILSPDTKIEWAIDWNDGRSAQNESLTWNEVWKQSAPDSWLQHIKFLTGDSSQSLRNYSGEVIDFAFIDAAHDYDGVRHDYYALLNHLGQSFGILFDDYAVKPTFGVYELIDKEVSPHFDLHLLQTKRQVTDDNDSSNAIYKMAWVHSDSLKQPLRDVYDFEHHNCFLDAYYYRKFPTTTQVMIRRAKRFLKRWQLRIQNRLMSVL
jgi:predicted O-methyltransferase YrrM